MIIIFWLKRFSFYEMQMKFVSCCLSHTDQMITTIIFNAFHSGQFTSNFNLWLGGFEMLTFNHNNVLMAINILEHFMREDRYQFFEEETISTYRFNIRKQK